MSELDGIGQALVAADDEVGNFKIHVASLYAVSQLDGDGVFVMWQQGLVAEVTQSLVMCCLFQDKGKIGLVCYRQADFLIRTLGLLHLDTCLEEVAQQILTTDDFVLIVYRSAVVLQCLAHAFGGTFFGKE